MITLAELLKQGMNQLLLAGVDEAETDAWFLMQHCFSITRADYYLNSHKAADLNQRKAYEDCIKKRGERIPLQYITGEQEFMGYSFMVNSHVLIPRQDTETLVEEVIHYVKDMGTEPKVLDMCTGSGCILISLALLCGTSRRVGADISSAAIMTAKLNAKKNGVSAEWVQSDLYENVEGTFDIIVSNPPYIESREIKGLMPEVRFHEPILALDGKEDGLYFYRQIIEKADAYLKEGGALFFEIGYNQAVPVIELLKEHCFEKVMLVRDLAGLDRVVWGMKSRRRPKG